MRCPRTPCDGRPGGERVRMALRACETTRHASARAMRCARFRCSGVHGPAGLSPLRPPASSPVASSSPSAPSSLVAATCAGDSSTVRASMNRRWRTNAQAGVRRQACSTRRREAQQSLGERTARASPRSPSRYLHAIRNSALGNCGCDERTRRMVSGVADPCCAWNHTPSTLATHLCHVVHVLYDPQLPLFLQVEEHETG